MSKDTLEHLSSLMDGELSRETGLFMARRLGSDEELRKTWKRYHLIRDCIRQPGSRHAVLDLSERMREALENEPGQTVPEPARRNRWLRPVAGLAIAASVALMAVGLVGQNASVPPAQGGTQTAGFTSPNPLPALPISEPASYSPDSRESERRLNSYLVRHNQLASSAGRQGFVSFVPIISTRVQDNANLKAEENPDGQAPATGTETDSRP